MVPSSVVTLALHVKFVSPVVLTVTVIVRVTVPPTTVAAGSESLSSTVAGTARNAPVRGSRYPRIPFMVCPLAACPHSVGTAIPRQQMHVNNSFVVLIVISFRGD
jgi:hypothetical protein